MNTQPLVVYLDTQDYIRLFNEADDGLAHKILDQLLLFRDRGDISIGYSWATMFEFITRPVEEYREDRVRRGQLIKDICGRNAFPYLSDLKQGARFPNNGNWMTGPDGKLISAKWMRRQLDAKYNECLAQQQGVNRGLRRKLKTTSGKRDFLSGISSTWGTTREDFNGLPVSKEFLESGVLPRFIKGQCSDAEFEERVNLWLSDPAEFSRIAYDYADKPDFLGGFYGPHLANFESDLKQLHELAHLRDKLAEKIRGERQNLVKSGLDRSKAKALLPSVKAPRPDPEKIILKLEEYTGEGRADHLAHYFLKASRKDYSFKRSDIMDIMQMCYVPDCDLFRCDKAMADLYKDFEPFGGKLVSKFTDLPMRIEERLNEVRNS